MTDTFLIYGSYGYSGNMIAEEAVRQGLRPILAGRDAEQLAMQAERLGLDWRAFSLDESQSLESSLADVPLVLNCAGPYYRTYQGIVEACLSTNTHYVDINGEIAVFEALAKLGDRAKEAGITLLTGMGMDVVPSDCLALYLKKRLPTATELTLAILTLTEGSSRGTALTAIEMIDKGGTVRQDGELVRIPLGAQVRYFDFGKGPFKMMAMPWGDVSTAYYSTGIPDIVVYMYVPASMRSLMAINRYAGWLLASRPVQWLLKRPIQAGPPGPPAEVLRKARSSLLAEVRAEDGAFAAARMQTPEGYTLTALTAVEGARRVLSGDFRPGFQTPAMAYGEDFILEFEGVTREDLSEAI